MILPRLFPWFIAALVIGAPLAAQDTATALVARFPFDENTGTNAASSVGSAFGTLNNGTAWTNGRINKAINLDGVDDYVELSNISSTVLGAANITLCSWMYARSPAFNAATHFVSNTRFILSVVTNNSNGYALQASNDGGSPANSGFFDSNTWIHQCTVRSGNSISFYINGALSGAANQNGGTPSVSNFAPVIGRYYAQSVGGPQFLGWVDDLRIYSRSLSAADVQKLYNDDNSNPFFDTIPPIISNIQSGVSPTTATITWTTNENSDSQIRYGTTTAYGALTALNSTMTKDHGVTISGLSPLTTYHYRVLSKDAAGNLSEEPTDRTFSTGAPPGTITNADSCSYSDVKAAIDAAWDEGIVQIPPGTCVWPHQMKINLTNPPRSLTVRSRDGCTLDTATNRPTTCSTIIRDGVAWCHIVSGESTTCSTTYQPGMVLGDWYGALFKITPATGRYFRLSGFQFETDSSITRLINPQNPGTAEEPNYIRDKNSAIITIGGTNDSFRIDHNIFDILGISGRPIFPTGELSGVIDHNRFGVNTGQAVAMFGEGSGNKSWSEPHSLGAARAIFIEDNEFKNLLVTDSWRGARYVIRRNDMETLTIPAQNHGAESGAGVRSGFSMEVYHNTVKVRDGHYLFYLRGGTGVFHNNAITGPNVTRLGNFINFRSWDDHPIIGGCYGVGPFDLNDPIIYGSGTHLGEGSIDTYVNNAVVPATLTTSGKNWQNDQWVGYSLYNVTKNWGSEIKSNTATTITTVPSAHVGDLRVTQHEWTQGDQFRILRPEICFDQNGRATGTRISDDTAPYVGDGILPKGWMNQSLEPVYAWANKINGQDNNLMGSTNYVVQRYRDYKEGVCRPGYTTYAYPHPIVQQQDNVGPTPLPLNCPPAIPSSTLTITKAGTGVGAVIGGPISCGVNCTATIPHGVSVTLKAASPPNAAFAGWSGGGCSGTGPCTVTLNGNITIIANFSGSSDISVPQAPGQLQLSAN